MFDNICKFLAENFSQDFATWLIGEPITSTKLNPSELSSEPIRADALILRESSRWILHIEFQTLPKKEIPFRMADYRIRGYRRFPNKQMLQYVIYLKKTTSELAYQNTFDIGNLRHEFNVIRLWEQPIQTFLTAPGLLPFAILSSTTDPENALIEVANRIEEISDKRTKSDLTASTYILAGLLLEKDFIQRVLRTEIMQESVTYQEILQQGLTKGRAEGQAEGREETTRLIAINLIRNDVSLENIVQWTGLSMKQVQQLQQEVNNG